MKKSLLILLAALLPVAGFAAINVERNPQAQAQPRATQRAKAPQRAIELGQNELIMGNYISESIAEQGSGLGLPSYPGTLSIAAVVPASSVKMFEGGKLKRIRVGMASAGTQVNKVFVLKLTATGAISSDTLACVAVNAALPYGWNEFALAEPAEIDATTASRGVAIGFEYEQLSTSTEATYPISTVEEGTIQVTYMKGLTGTTGWVDVGLTDYGNLSVQAVVESDHFPEFNLQLSNLATYGYAMVGGKLSFMLDAANMGVGTVENFAVTTFVDGVEVETIPVEQALNVMPVTVELEATVPADIAPGKHTIEIVGARLNDQAIGEPGEGQRLSTPIYVYNKEFDRQKYLIEHITSNSCTYCPLGENMLTKLSQMRDDIAWVSIHGNQSSVDPYNTTKATQQLNLLGYSFFPGAVFNRLDFGFQGSLPVSIGYYEDYAAQAAQYYSEYALNPANLPALATVNIDGTLDPDTRKLDLTISGNIHDGLVEMFDGKVGYTVYITEDSLVARQLNQGRWVTKYTHNHVMRDRLTTAAAGDALTLVGTTDYENTLSTTLPAAWNIDKLHVIAFVSRTEGGTNLHVFNTEMADVKDFIKAAVKGDVNGDGLLSGADVTALYGYLLDGTAVAGNADVNGDGTISGADVTALYGLLLEQ